MKARKTVVAMTLAAFVITGAVVVVTSAIGGAGTATEPSSITLHNDEKAQAELRARVLREGQILNAFHGAVDVYLAQKEIDIKKPSLTNVTIVRVDEIADTSFLNVVLEDKTTMFVRYSDVIAVRLLQPPLATRPSK